MHKFIIALVCAFSVIACQNQKVSAPTATAPAKPMIPSTELSKGTSTVVAKIGDKEITDADVRAYPSVKPNLFKATEQIYNAKKQEFDTLKGGLEQLLTEAALDAEAKAKKTTPAALLESEVSAKTKTPTDAEAQAFYDEKKINRPYEEIKPKIIEYLKAQEEGEKTKEYVAALMKKHNIEMLLGDFMEPRPLPPKVEFEIASTAPAMGPSDAPITIVEFSDYECPFCERAERTVKQVMKEYEGKIRLVFKHYPLPFHQNAKLAHMAAECAKEQGKFWEYHNQLFENQKQLARTDLDVYADTLSLDKTKFDACLESDKTAKVVEDNIELGKSVGVTGTPAFFINGRMISGAKPFEEFAELINMELPQS